jgi:hypothetical protein
MTEVRDHKSVAREAETARLQFLAQIEKRRGPFVKSRIALAAFGRNPTPEAAASYAAAKAVLDIEDESLAVLDAARQSKQNR